MRLFRLNYLVPFMMLMICSACRPDASKNLEAREKQIQSKEQALAERERQLTLREQQLLLKEKVIDSLNGRSDTISTYEPLIVGNWMVTMECTETTCEGSAIGDTKTEQWKIYYQNNRVIAEAIADKKVIRTYGGLFKNNSLQLVVLKAPNPETQMNVTLIPHQNKPDLMEGQRIINQGGHCKIVYRLKAEKL